MVALAIIFFLTTGGLLGVVYVLYKDIQRLSEELSRSTEEQKRLTDCFQISKMDKQALDRENKRLVLELNIFRQKVSNFCKDVNDGRINKQ